MARVFLLTNCDEADVKSVANDDENSFRNDDDTNSNENNDPLKSSSVLTSTNVLDDIADPTGGDGEFDFLLLLGVILSTDNSTYNTCNKQSYVFIDF